MSIFLFFHTKTLRKLVEFSSAGDRVQLWTVMCLAPWQN